MNFKGSLAIAALNGKDIQQVRKRISERIWPESTEETQKQNVSNLLTGKKKNYSMLVIIVISEETGATPNFIFGYDEKTNAFIH